MTKAVTKSTKQTNKSTDSSERERLLEIFSQAPAAIGIVRGEDHIFEFTNRLYMELVGKKSSLIGKSVREVFPELEGQGFFELLDNVYKTGEPFAAKEMAIDLVSEGESKPTRSYLNFVYQPYKDKNGKVQGIMAHAVDVSEHVLDRQKFIQLSEKLKENKKALQKQLRITEALTNNATACLFMVDNKGLVTFLNPSATRVTGFTAKDAVGKPMHKLIHHSHPDGSPYPESECPLVASYKYGKPSPEHEDVFFRKNGTHIPVMTTGTPIPGPGGIKATVVEFRDITDEKSAVATLAESEAQLRFMAESMPQKIFTAKPSGEIDYFNPQWIEYTGLTFEQIRNWGWIKFVHPEDVQENVKIWKNSIKTGEPFVYEQRFKRADGVYHWHISRAHPQHDEKGKIIKWIGSNTDVDDLKKSHEIKERLALLTRQRNELIEINKVKDEFVSIASHQLRTPATAVKQYVGLLLDQYAGELSAEQMQFLQVAYDSNERQLTIINDLLKTAALDSNGFSLKKSEQNIFLMITEVISQFRATLKYRKQKVSFECEDNNISAKIDEAEIRLVLSNLVDNASKYTHPGKEIKIRLSIAGNKVRIAVSDEGVGIDKANMKRIFDKFTRVDNELSDTVSGTGLGLYWAKKIIKLHKGTLRVTSDIKQGSTFVVCLPL